MYGDVLGDPFQLDLAPLDLERGDEIRGSRQREDVVGDEDLVGAGERPSPARLARILALDGGGRPRPPSASHSAAEGL